MYKTKNNLYLNLKRSQYFRRKLFCKVNQCQVAISGKKEGFVINFPQLPKKLSLSDSQCSKRHLTLRENSFRENFVVSSKGDARS